MGEVAELVEGAGDLWSWSREPGLARALLLYHAHTGHERALELLARAPEPHARHLADAVRDELPRVLAALPALLARRPPALLPRLATPALLRDLARLAQHAAHSTHATHALLSAAVLAASAPAASAPALPDLAAALLHALPPPSPHVALAARALFHALYATQPCALADALRDALAGREPAARERAERALTPLLEGARLHPLLVLRREPRRRLEPHDVPAELRRYELEARGSSPPAPRSPPAAAPPAPPPSARRAAPLRPGVEPWFPLAERAGADSAPHTPLPAEGGSPPEAAVEATPENTPAKEQRAASSFHFPSESGAVRALGRLSQPPSPLRKEANAGAGGGAGALGGMEARLARVVLERARAEPSPPPDEDEPPSPPATWPTPAPWLAPPAPCLAVPVPCKRRGRRAASCPPPSRSHACDHAHTQTVDTHPHEYEFVLADFYKTIADPPLVNKEKEECPMTDSVLYARLDAYLTSMYSGGGCGGGSSGEAADLAAQLAMTHAHLMHERWRRDAHAERNRRLLGRCRAARATELAARDLRESLRALTAERDALRAREPPAAVRAEPAAPAAQHAALLAERAARDRAEAALRDAEAQRLHEQGEARRARARAAEAGRRADCLARAAALAERRGDLVASLRRELVLLGEREARLHEAVRASAAAGAGVAASSAALAAARAEAGAARDEADAAKARAEALAARLAEAEAALGAREAALTSARRAAKAVGAEAAARLEALQDKYRALMHVLRRMEARRLELAGGGVREPSPASSPLSASLASHASEPADCRRVHDLLDDGDA